MVMPVTFSVMLIEPTTLCLDLMDVFTVRDMSSIGAGRVVNCSSYEIFAFHVVGLLWFCLLNIYVRHLVLLPKIFLIICINVQFVCVYTKGFCVCIHALCVNVRVWG